VTAGDIGSGLTSGHAFGAQSAADRVGSIDDILRLRAFRMLDVTLGWPPSGNQPASPDVEAAVRHAERLTGRPWMPGARTRPLWADLEVLGAADLPAPDPPASGPIDR